MRKRRRGKEEERGKINVFSTWRRIIEEGEEGGGGKGEK